MTTTPIRTALRAARAETRLPAHDLVRARAWYAEKLGLVPAEERDGGLRYECASGVFCLYRTDGAADGSFTQLAFNVDDIEAVVAELRARGVEIGSDAWADGGVFDVDGNYPSKGTGERGAFVRDSEGNTLAFGQAVGAPGRPRPTRVRGVSVLLASTDPDRLRDFYVTVFDAAVGEGGWLGLGGLGLLCDRRDDVADRAVEPARQILTVEVDDASAVCARLDEQAVEWVCRLERRPDGLFATAHDPDGNLIQVLQLDEAYHRRVANSS